MKASGEEDGRLDHVPLPSAFFHCCCSCYFLHFELNFADFDWRNGESHHEVPCTHLASVGGSARFQSVPSARSLNS